MELPVPDLEKPWHSTQVPDPEALTEMAELERLQGIFPD
jgi:hypothetical protein